MGSRVRKAVAVGVALCLPPADVVYAALSLELDLSASNVTAAIRLGEGARRRHFSGAALPPLTPFGQLLSVPHGQTQVLSVVNIADFEPIPSGLIKSSWGSIVPTGETAKLSVRSGPTTQWSGVTRPLDSARRHLETHGVKNGDRGVRMATRHDDFWDGVEQTSIRSRGVTSNNTSSFTPGIMPKGAGPPPTLRPFALSGMSQILAPRLSPRGSTKEPTPELRPYNGRLIGRMITDAWQGSSEAALGMFGTIVSVMSNDPYTMLLSLVGVATGLIRAVGAQNQNAAVYAQNRLAAVREFRESGLPSFMDPRGGELAFDDHLFSLPQRDLVARKANKGEILQLFKESLAMEAYYRQGHSLDDDHAARLRTLLRYLTDEAAITRWEPENTSEQDEITQYYGGGFVRPVLVNYIAAYQARVITDETVKDIALLGALVDWTPETGVAALNVMRTWLREQGASSGSKSPEDSVNLAAMIRRTDFLEKAEKARLSPNAALSEEAALFLNSYDERVRLEGFFGNSMDVLRQRLSALHNFLSAKDAARREQLRALDHVQKLLKSAQDLCRSHFTRPSEASAAVRQLFEKAGLTDLLTQFLLNGHRQIKGKARAVMAQVSNG